MADQNEADLKHVQFQIALPFDLNVMVMKRTGLDPTIIRYMKAKAKEQALKVIDVEFENWIKNKINEA